MIALVLASVLTLAPADSVEAPCPGGAVVTRAELAASGALHLHDALRLAGALDGVTVDGFDVAPVGGALPFARPVRVLLDGAPVALGAGPEPAGLTALPVALAEVARVVVCPGDGLAAGALGGPWIDVRTGPPARVAYASVAYGNEAGDPGPLRYLGPAGNVDRWGPYLEGALGGDVRAVVRHRDFLPTDPAVLYRARAVTGRYPKRVGTIGALAGDVGGLRVRVAGRRFTDLAYAPGLATERGFSHDAAQATAAVRQRVGGVDVGGHAHVARLRLGLSARDSIGFDPGWAETRLDAALSARRGGGAVGVRVEHVDASAPGVDDALTVGRGWAQATGRRGQMSGTAVVEGTAAGGGLGGGAVADGTWRASPSVRVRLSGSARRALPEAERDEAFWRGRGYGPFGALLPDARPLDVARLRLEASWARGPGRAWAAAEGLGARGALALSAPGALGTLSEADGTAAVGQVGASWQRRGLRVRGVARAQGAVAGTDGFRDAWRRLPRLSSTLDLLHQPDARLALWARLDLRSATTWAGFPEPDLPALALLDLGLSKRFWGDALRLSLGGRNVLGVEERTHPLGADLAPRLFVRAEARL